jgi:RNA polymerase sporulation-specific sigma factor
MTFKQKTEPKFRFCFLFHCYNIEHISVNKISLIDVLKSEGNDIIDEIQLNMELEQVKKYIDVLDEREKEVIISRFGLDMQREKTQREIAKELGISRSYVSRIEKRALMKMFHEFYRN